MCRWQLMFHPSRCSSPQRTTTRLQAGARTRTHTELGQLCRPRLGWAGLTTSRRPATRNPQPTIQVDNNEYLIKWH